MPMIGQMTEVHRQQGAQSQLTRYHVDVNGQMTQVACTGQHIDFRYDATGRLIEECLNGQAIAYEYDANGNRLKTRLPSGDSLGYFYYGSGHLSGIKLNSQLISEMERDELHREISRSQGRLNGRYYYDDMGRLVQQQAGLANQQNAVQIDRTYGYDELGHLIQTRTHCPQQPFEAPHQTQYQYDSLGRIQQEKTGTQRHTFYFDPASNLINDPTEKVINNRVSHYQGVRYTYDSLGNLTECQTANGDSQRYTYDLKHQLIRADIHNRYTTESWVYDYDPLGRRIAKSKLNKQGEKQCHTQFIWAGSHLVQEIRKGKNGEETDRTFTYIYTHTDSYEPLAQCYKEGDNAEHTVNYFHCDQIGIPREMTDSQGKLLWKGRYDAWGQLIHDSNRHAQRTTHQPFRLQNQYFDQETGLHYNFLRYYEPALGRFITQDPIGLMGGMNLYRFANNAQKYIDPLGWNPVAIGAYELLLLMFGGATAATIITANDDDISMPSSISESATPTTNCEKRKKCQEATVENIKKVVANTSYQTNQRSVSVPAVARYTAMIEAGSIAPPVYMDGMLIVEGNHRMVAGLLCEQLPPIQPWASSPSKPRYLF